MTNALYSFCNWVAQAVDCIWSLPEHLIRPGLERQGSDAIAPFIPGLIQLAQDAIDMVSSLTPDECQPSRIHSKTVFFRILLAAPEAKKILMPLHIPKSNSLLSISLCTPLGEPRVQDFSVQVGLAPRTLDLSALDQMQVLRNLLCWQSGAHSSRLSLPDVVEKKLSALDEYAQRGSHCVLSNVGGVMRKDLIPHPDSVVFKVVKLVRSLDENGAYHENDKYMHVGNTNLPDDAMQILLDHHLIQRRGNDEFALLDNLVWLVSVSIGMPMLSLGLAMPSNIERASKLQLVLYLARHGWTALALTTTPITPDGPRVMSVAMMHRSKRYFEALASCEHLFERGCKRISHHRPHAYYDCLFMPGFSFGTK